MSSADLMAEIRRRQKAVVRLERKRSRLEQRLAAIDNELRRHGHTVGAVVGRRRPHNKMSLIEALSRVLTDKSMSVTEVAEAVQRAGYRTSAQNFRTIVNQALINSGRFKRVARGHYTAK